MSYLKAFLDGAARAFINFAPHGYEGKGPWQGEPAKLEGGSYIRKAYWHNCGQQVNPLMHFQSSSRQRELIARARRLARERFAPGA